MKTVTVTVVTLSVSLHYMLFQSIFVLSINHFCLGYRRGKCLGLMESIENFTEPFLDASSHLYKSVYLSICPSVGMSVRPLVI